MHASTATIQHIHPPATVDEPDLRQRVLEALEIDPGLTQARIAKEIGQGVSGATLSQWLGGSYRGDNAKVEARLAAWYETYQERRARAGLPDAPQWVETSTTQRIESGLRYAQLAQDIVVIYGPAGVSKTKTCQRYATIAPGVVHATMTPATHSVIAALKEIALAMGLRGGELGSSASALQHQLVGRLRGTNGLLIIDEAQHLGIQALDEIRSLHDACLIGVALVGNETVYSRMTGGNRAPYLDRLYSRIGKRVALKGATEADIDALIAAWKIHDTSCRAQIREIARRPGALRVLTKVLRLAASFAAAQGHAICCEDVRAAWKDLGAME
jgi:DNA transposition AAA+ family ATPase